MTGPAALATAFALAGCMATTPSLAPASQPVTGTSGSSAAQSADGSPHPSPRGAADLLDCDGPVSGMGGLADEFGPEGGGATADEAFRSWIDATAFAVPRSGYRRVGSLGDRAIYAYEADGRAKVIVVISPRFRALAGTAFTIEELRTCVPSEFGTAVDLGPGRRVWTHVTTGEILVDIEGPSHCGWQSARMLHISDADGNLARQYLRDPQGVFADIPAVSDTYAEGIELPADATFSGYRSADGHELWFTTTDEAAYVVTPHGVERWPRAEEPIACG